MTIDELIPSIISLSHAEKIRLLQVVVQQLARETTASQHTELPRAANPLKGSVTFEKDILSPIDEQWDAVR
jgi:hypothetical protein